MYYHRTVDLWPQILPFLAKNTCYLCLASPACPGVTIFSFVTTDLNAKLWRAFLFWPCVRTAWKLTDFDIYSAAAGQFERKNLAHHKLIPFELVVLKCSF
jgi:hypothetical protein